MAEQKTLQELKSAAFDRIRLIERLQQELNIITKQIAQAEATTQQSKILKPKDKKVDVPKPKEEPKPEIEQSLNTEKNSEVEEQDGDKK